MRLATSVTTTVLMTLLIATIAYGGVRMQLHPTGLVSQPTPSHAPPTKPSPVAVLPSPITRPAPPAALDVDMIDGTKGWALSTSCNGESTQPCAYFVSVTVNAGRTWSNRVQVGPRIGSTNGDAPRHIHFIDAQHGFVWGGFEAYSTYNGGRTWSPATLRASEYVGFTGRGQMVWALTYPCKKGGGLNSVCIFQVSSSQDGGRTWSAPYALPTGFVAPAGTAFGARGLLVTGGPSAGMQISSDGGASWRSVDPQCANGTFSELNATPDGDEIFKVCVGPLNAQPDSVTLLHLDKPGQSWKAVPIAGVDPLQGLVLIASPAIHTAVVASIQSTLAITHDAGATWDLVGPANTGFVTIGFGSATNGYAVDVLGNLWVTQDGGNHWSSPAAG